MERINKFFSELQHYNADAFLITGTPNIRYLTNFTGEDAFLLAVNEKLFLIVDSRFTEQAQEEVFEGVEVLEYTPPITKFVYDLLLKNKVHWLAIEKNRMSAELFLSLSEFAGINIVPLSGIVEHLRMVKEPKEVETIKKACEISSKSFKEMLPFIKEGVTERDIAAELEYRFRKNGADKTSFDTITAAGERGALPHGMPSNRKVKAHELIVIDFGVFYNGYASDTTRTVCIGEPDEKSLKVYNIVKAAQQLGRDAVKEGVICKDIDKTSRDYISKQGFGKYFIHGLGHGVGLEIHELPFVNSRSDIVLKENMVITIEPGIYLPGEFGVRIEDSILVKKDGYEIMTKLPHDLIKL